jgi:hypothetical protein
MVVLYTFSSLFLSAIKPLVYIVMAHGLKTKSTNDRFVSKNSISMPLSKNDHCLPSLNMNGCIIPRPPSVSLDLTWASSIGNEHFCVKNNTFSPLKNTYGFM